MAKRFITPFALNGDRTDVLDPSQADGIVNYSQGYTPRYSLDVATEPTARRLNRDRFNQIMFDVTSNVQQWQNHLYPSYVPSSENGGVLLSYRAGMVVDFNGVNRVSLVDSNTALPSDNLSWADESIRPLVLGGTGASTAVQARANLGVIQATASATGLSRFSTDAEAIAGMLSDVSVTPSALLAALAAALTPVGTLLFFSGAVVPDGYLEVNGSAFNMIANPQLALIHPSGILPDMRGEFPRGLDSGRGIDPGRVRGSAQSSAFAEHRHDLFVPANGTVYNVSSVAGHAQLARASLTGAGTTGISFTGLNGESETRSRNLAYMWIVRAA